MLEKLVAYIVKTLVSMPEAVMITSIETPEKCTIQVRVAEADIARVIGSEGRILRALRTMAASSAHAHKDIAVDIVR